MRFYMSGKVPWRSGGSSNFARKKSDLGGWGGAAMQHKYTREGAETIRCMWRTCGIIRQVREGSKYTREDKVQAEHKQPGCTANLN